MTLDEKNTLIEAGMDVDSALGRFMGNEALLEKFIKKFLSDKCYNDLLEAVNNKDNDSAFRASHTLKGVAANFSFDRLKNAASDQCECFRANKTDEGIDLMNQVSSEYEKIKAAIIKLYGDV